MQTVTRKLTEAPLRWSRYEPFLTFIGMTEHMHQLKEGSRAGPQQGLQSGDGNLEEPDSCFDNIDSGVFVPSATSTGSTHGTPADGMVCAATGVAIDSSNYVEYLTAPSMQWAASQYVHLRSYIVDCLDGRHKCISVSAFSTEFTANLPSDRLLLPGGAKMQSKS